MVGVRFTAVVCNSCRSRLVEMCHPFIRRVDDFLLFVIV